jgi:hypothetical protein
MAMLVPPVEAETVLVPAGSVWKYLDDGSDQGTLWREVDFVDSAWASGAAQLGYGDGDEATVVSYGPDPDMKHVTTYFRHEFTVADSVVAGHLIVRLLRDDGALVYLNGTEIVRSYMPDGTVGHETFALGTVSSGEEDYFYEYAMDAAPLVVGSNHLAVEIHQRSRTSSDISLDLELVASPDPPPLFRKAPYLIHPGDVTEMQLHWQLRETASCTVEWGPDSSCSAGSAETSEYGGDHQHTYTITELTPGARSFYRVTAGHEELSGSFYTPPEDEVSDLKFLAYGDTRSHTGVHDTVAEAMLAAFAGDPDFQTFIAVAGDLVYDGDSEDVWDMEFFDRVRLNIKEMLGSAPYHSAMGNHELPGDLFIKYFSYPFVDSRYWSFDYGPLHMVVLDQYTPYGPGSAQLEWVEANLALTEKPWRMICLHEPGWSAGGHSNEIPVQNYIQPLCEVYGVAMILGGHNHYYARAVVNGVQHITTGGGGAPLDTPNPNYPNVVATARAHHFCKIEISGDLLTFSAVTPTGQLIDSFEMTSPVSAVTPPQLAASTWGSAWPNPFTYETTISCSSAPGGLGGVVIFDPRGRVIRRLRPPSVGAREVRWDGKDALGKTVPSGIYFYRREADAGRQTQRLVVVR